MKLCKQGLAAVVLSLVAWNCSAQTATITRGAAHASDAPLQKNLQATFYSAGGKFQLKGELVAFADGIATLKRADGTLTTVPLNKLRDDSQTLILNHVSDGDELRAIAKDCLTRFEDQGFGGRLLEPKGFTGKMVVYDVELGLVNPHFYGNLKVDRRAINREEVGTVVLVKRVEETVTSFNTSFGAQFGAKGYPGIIVHHYVAMIDVAQNKLVGRFAFLDKRDMTKKDAIITESGPFDSGGKVYVGTLHTADSVQPYLANLKSAQ